MRSAPAQKPAAATVKCGGTGRGAVVADPRLPAALLLGLLYLLLYWAACWVYADARRRGMLAALWSLLALLCPPSLLAYLALRRRRAVSDPTAAPRPSSPG